MVNSIKPITGTFIDEITFDIPSQNWRIADWIADLDAMQVIGIDTIIIIRGGLRKKTVFPSKVIGSNPIYDLAKLLFEETGRRKMNLFIGTYDSWDWVSNGKWKEEIAINKLFMKEISEKYGDYPSFKGWYLTHETSHRRFHFREIYFELSQYAKELTPGKKVLISPYYPSSKIYSDNYLTPDEFADNWLGMLNGIKSIDYAAFQDGTASLDELESYLRAAKSAMDELKIELWGNIETFSRDMPIKFPPVDINDLIFKLKLSDNYVKKNITFEFSHFMSPNSSYFSARNLYKRYMEYFNI